jgi:hypothetical protein
MSYEVIWEPRGVVKRYFGHVTDQELTQGVIETEADARFDSLRYAINDFLACESFAVTPASAEEIAIMDRGASFSNPYIRIAVVAVQPEIIALSQAYANSPLNVYPTRIFPTEREAREWIGKP